MLIAMPAVAQETYQDTKLFDNDLNGTARYVGMGGAMEALGADISTISTNPAGIGLFRSSQISVSGGGVFQQDNDKSFSFNGSSLSMNDGGKAAPSFDQAGFVYAYRTGQSSFMNFAFNYHKSRNFNQLLNAANFLHNASQNKNTVRKDAYAYELEQQGHQDAANMIWNSVDANYSALLQSKGLVGEDGSLNYLNATDYMYGQWERGYIGEYDFNLSGNIDDCVFLGFTAGIHDVHYRQSGFYAESLEQGTFAENTEYLKITGTGYDMKFGAIIRPIETSNFRIGVYVNTPTWYDLTLRGQAITSLGTLGADDGESADNSFTYDYKVFTPWKFGVSLGHTIDNFIALGATYEYADYSHTKNRINDGAYYDWYNGYQETSSNDLEMNDHTRNTLRGVSLVKVGAEVKVLPELAVRVGYNYQSSLFDSKGERNGAIISPGSCYSASTQYTNWKDLNRITLGVGYRAGKHWNLDLAYQYTTQNGDFYPFMNNYFNETGYNDAEDNVATASEVNFKRHQLLFTVGYKF